LYSAPAGASDLTGEIFSCDMALDIPRSHFAG
jgi:hypothetical protein